MLLFPVIIYGFRAIELGLEVKIQKGDTSVEIHKDDDKTKGRKWFTWIQSHCDFDQLIWEHSKTDSYWVHVSYRSDGKNRK